MIREPFDRSKHVYHNEAFVELVKDAVRFFNGTPVHNLPPSEKFTGTGIYALYYTGNNALYKRYADLNRLSYDFPIYVGKAVPKGWRQSRTSDTETNQSSELFSRLRHHGKNIKDANSLEISDFYCRFVIFEREGSDMISTIEAALIKLNRPLWNCCLDGFGNHDPGSGRYEQAPSEWDILHPGRTWADRLKGTPKHKNSILSKVEEHLQGLKKFQ